MNQSDPPARAGLVQVPYRVLTEIQVSVTRLETQLATALTLQGNVEALEKRVSDLEIKEARSSGRSGAWSRAVDLLWPVFIAFVAGGAGYLFGSGTLPTP